MGKLTIGIGLIVAIFASVDLGDVVLTLASIDPRWFFVLCVVAILLRALKSYKWWLLLRARNVSISPWQSMRLSFEGNIIGTMTPAGIGSDFYRIAALSEHQKHKDVISTLMVERLIGYTVLVVTVAISLPFSAEFIDAGTHRALFIIIGLFLVLVFAVLVLLQLRYLKAYVNNVLIPAFSLLAGIRGVISACLEFRHRWFLLMCFALLTALEIATLVIISYLAARSLYIELPFMFLLTVVPLMQMLIRLPVSFQALGIQEGLYAYALLIAGFSAEDGLSISIVMRIVDITVILLPGVLLLLTRTKLPRE